MDNTPFIEELHLAKELYLYKDGQKMFHGKSAPLLIKKFFILYAVDYVPFFSRIPQKKYFIESTGGKVWLNGKVIRSRKKLTIDQEITLDGTTFTIRNGYFNDLTPLIEVNNLEIRVKDQDKKEKILVQPLSFRIERGTFVAFMGPSGCGKTTLLKELAGENNHNSGQIRMAQLPIEKYFHSDLKAKIGYVQQFDNLHENLTVQQALFYTAKIKRIISVKDNIKKVIEQLQINDFKDRVIYTLSGGQKKKVAIAIELLDDPDILLLDEPTSPLDPQSVNGFLQALKELSSKYNKAVVMVTHKPGDVKFADKVLFMGACGYKIYEGPSKGFVEVMRTDVVLNHLILPPGEDLLLSIYQLYSIASNAKKVYKQPVFKPIVTYTEPKKTYRQSYNFFIQLFWLLMRYIRIKFPTKPKAIPQATTLDLFRNIYEVNIEKNKHSRSSIIKSSYFNYLIQPIIIGLLFLAFPNFTVTSLFLISLAVIWFGVNNACKEIVGEFPIYKRERAFNLKVDAYLLSKIILLSIIGAFQIVILLLIVWARFEFVKTGNYNSINLYDPVKCGIFLFVLSVASTMLGLLASTFYEKMDKVLMLVPLLLIPQIIFSGLVSKPDISLKENLSYCMIGRLGLEGMCRIQDSSSKQTPVVVDEYLVNKSNSIVIEGVNPPPFDTMIYTTNNALYTIGYYNENTRRDGTKAWSWFNNLKGNYITLLLHIIIMYLLCRLVLISKDKIPYNKKFGRKVILFFVYSIVTLISAVVIGSIFYKEKKKEKHFFAKAPRQSQNIDSGIVGTWKKTNLWKAKNKKFNEAPSFMKLYINGTGEIYTPDLNKKNISANFKWRINESRFERWWDDTSAIEKFNMEKKLKAVNPTLILKRLVDTNKATAQIWEYSKISSK